MVLLALLPFVFHLWEDPPTSEKKVETDLKIDKRLLMSKGRCEEAKNGTCRAAEWDSASPCVCTYVWRSGLTVLGSGFPLFLCLQHIQRKMRWKV